MNYPDYFYDKTAILHELEKIADEKRLRSVKKLLKYTGQKTCFCLQMAFHAYIRKFYPCIDFSDTKIIFLLYALDVRENGMELPAQEFMEVLASFYKVPRIECEQRLERLLALKIACSLHGNDSCTTIRISDSLYHLIRTADFLVPMLSSDLSPKGITYLQQNEMSQIKECINRNKVSYIVTDTCNILNVIRGIEFAMINLHSFVCLDSTVTKLVDVFLKAYPKDCALLMAGCDGSVIKDGRIFKDLVNEVQNSGHKIILAGKSSGKSLPGFHINGEGEDAA